MTAHLGYTHSLDAIHGGIDGLEHVLISPYNEFCAVNQQFGFGASMLDPTFFPRLIKGWEEADLKADGARSWMGAMVDRQVNMGTTLDLRWLAKFGINAARHDPDRKLIPPMALKRQKQMVAHMGEGPDWDVGNPLAETASGAKALEKHQVVTRTLHEAGGLIVGGTDCGGLSYPPHGFALLREIELLAEAIGSMAAIRAVTSVAAQYLRQQDNLGSVAPGRYADLLIVDGDPISDERERRKLKTVYRGGVAYDGKRCLPRCRKGISSTQRKATGGRLATRRMKTSRPCGAPSRDLQAIGRAAVAGTPQLPIVRIASRRCRDARADRHDGACEHPAALAWQEAGTSDRS